MHEQGDVTLQTLLLHTENPADIEQAGAILRGGGLVAIPTETVYGLAADALNPEAAKAIFAAKGRPADNPLIVHICDLNQWPELVREIPGIGLAAGQSILARPADNYFAACRLYSRCRECRFAYGCRALPVSSGRASCDSRFGLPAGGALGKSFRQTQPYNGGSCNGRYGRPYRRGFRRRPL